MFYCYMFVIGVLLMGLVFDVVIGWVVGILSVVGSFVFSVIVIDVIVGGVGLFI